MSFLRIYAPYHSDTKLATKDESIINRFKQYNSKRDFVVFVDEPNNADLIILFEQISYKWFKHRYQLISAPIIVNFANKIFTVNYDDFGQGFLPGCYTSLRTGNFRPHLYKACAYPKSYNEYLAVAANDVHHEAQLLFSFRGNLDSHPIRQQLYNLFGDSEEAVIHAVNQPFYSHNECQKQAYVSEILDSHFVLCPRGASPSTYRLFEAMQLGRCPVIISDEWVPIEGVPWEECSIRIVEEDIGLIPLILKSRLHEASTLGRNAALMWQQHFSEEGRFRAYFDMIRGLHLERVLSGKHFDFDQLIQMWNSWDFRWRNGWTFPQKVVKKSRTLHHQLLHTSGVVA